VWERECGEIEEVEEVVSYDLENGGGFMRWFKAECRESES
jgi:hypothetical protein